MGRVKWDGVRLAGKVYSLSYTDDVVLLAKDEKGMRNMIGRLEVFGGKRARAKHKQKQIVRGRE